MTKIIVAIDNLAYQEAKERGIFTNLSKAAQRQMIWGVKLNDLIYTENPRKIISELKRDYGLSVMIDLKFHDIPSTMENGISKLVQDGADIITIHCSSNYRPKNPELLKHLAGVTLLTSLTNIECRWIYGRPVEEMIRAFADIALMNNYEYLMGSVHGLGYIQDNPLKKICTGIRPPWYTQRHDQVRVSSLKEAVRMEIDYLVIGRPIMKSPDIMEAIERVYSETR